MHLGEELSDVFLYLTRLADRCDVDLPSAVLRKLEKNAEKYPADRYGQLLHKKCGACCQARLASLPLALAHPLPCPPFLPPPFSCL